MCCFHVVTNGVLHRYVLFVGGLNHNPLCMSLYASGLDACLCTGKSWIEMKLYPHRNTYWFFQLANMSLEWQPTSWLESLPMLLKMWQTLRTQVMIFCKLLLYYRSSFVFPVLCIILCCFFLLCVHLTKKADIFHIGRLSHDTCQYYGWVILLLLDFWWEKFSTQVSGYTDLYISPHCGELMKSVGQVVIDKLLSYMLPSMVPEQVRNCHICLFFLFPFLRSSSFLLCLFVIPGAGSP
jgi:hypothetical protein